LTISIQNKYDSMVDDEKKEERPLQNGELLFAIENCVVISCVVSVVRRPSVGGRDWNEPMAGR